MFRGKEFKIIMDKYREHGQKEAHESELTSLFSQLKRLVEKKVSMFWHIKSFENYIPVDMNPFGLRIQIFPTLDMIDTVFRKRWENNF